MRMSCTRHLLNDGQLQDESQTECNKRGIVCFCVSRVRHRRSYEGAHVKKMSFTYFDTETPDVLSLTPDTKSNIVAIGRPWGRLYSTYIYLEAVDLEKRIFKLGRSEDCDMIITERKIPSHRVTNISKLHFVITKEDDVVFIEDFSKNGTFLNGNLIGKGNKNILQNDDEIAIGLKGLKVYVFKILETDENKYLPEQLRKKYQVSRTLGVGACGEVKLVFDKVTCLPYAVKKIVKGQSSRSAQNRLNHPEKIQSEIRILKNLNYPCIIEMKEIVETEEAVFIILEYMDGGELSDMIMSFRRMSESQVKFYFYQIVLAVKYLHTKGITHRDLKPENVLLQSRSYDSLVKVSDFGLSKLIEENAMMETVCGTPNYVAPEVIDKRVTTYTKQVDVWSMGVILFYMLSQELPFRSPDRSSLSRKVLLGQFEFRGENWDDVSEKAKDLVCRMLTVDPKRRITVNEILAHPWISDDIQTTNKVDTIINNAMKTGLLFSSEESEESYSPESKRSRLSDSL